MVLFAYVDQNDASVLISVCFITSAVTILSIKIGQKLTKVIIPI